MRKYSSFIFSFLFLGTLFAGCSFGKDAPDTAMPPLPSQDRAQVKKALMQKHQVALTNVHVTFVHQTPDYVRGEASVGLKGDEPKKVFLAAKKAGKWEIVAENGELSCAALEPYHFPAEMIADCTR